VTRDAIARGVELDVARCALHLREAARAARRLGILSDGIGPRLAAGMIVSELERATHALGSLSVPELRLEETELPQRLALRELLEALRAEFH
jgi:hypothetical protein